MRISHNSIFEFDRLLNAQLPMPSTSLRARVTRPGRVISRGCLRTEVGVERVSAVSGPFGQAAGYGVLRRVDKLPHQVRPHELVGIQQLRGRRC